MSWFSNNNQCCYNRCCWYYCCRRCCCDYCGSENSFDNEIF